MKLPIGIQTFREIREKGYYYVDKTDHARRLVEGGKYYFLSRPRRFGKSLLVDTLQELFEGNEELFRGLAVHGEWDWSARHPVVRLDFSGGEFGDPDGVREDVEDQLEATERLAGLEASPVRASIRFRRLIRTLHERTGQQVVVLVDEYDKPILDALSKPEVAWANRDFLRSLYGAIKACDRHLRFVFLTGVSKFSKVSLFSGLNNLRDVTLDPRYSAICGYTETDLDAVFGPELPGLDRDEIRRWYNGYNWRGAEKVYNPFDVLLLFDMREFGAHWFETGTPTFLIETLLRHGVASPDLDGLSATDDLLSAFDVDEISAEALLFQTGYLTIVGEDEFDGEQLYRLGYPNHEVRKSLNARLLRAMTPGGPGAGSRPSAPFARRGRLCGSGGAVPGFLRRHSVPVAREERDRPIRRLLRQRGLLVVCGGGAGRSGGGQRRRGASGHGGAVRRPGVPVRVQDGGEGAGGVGAGAAEGEGLRREVPPSWAADPPDRGRVQPRGAQRCGVRGRKNLSDVCVEADSLQILPRHRTRAWDCSCTGPVAGVAGRSAAEPNSPFRFLVKSALTADQTAPRTDQSLDSSLRFM